MSSRGGDSLGAKRRRKPKPRRGDVVEVELVEPNDRVKIRLHEHPFTYIARPTIISKQAGPELAELTIIADDGDAIDLAGFRAVPVRMLAVTAIQALGRLGGRVSLVGGVQTEGRGIISVTDTKAYEAAQLAEEALALGLPVRPTVADKLGVSKATIDRWLKRAKAEGWFEDAPLPKRPPPQQRDATDSLGLSDSFTVAITTEGNQ